MRNKKISHAAALTIAPAVTLTLLSACSNSSASPNIPLSSTAATFADNTTGITPLLDPQHGSGSKSFNRNSMHARNFDIELGCVGSGTMKVILAKTANNSPVATASVLCDNKNHHSTGGIQIMLPKPDSVYPKVTAPKNAHWAFEIYGG